MREDEVRSIVRDEVGKMLAEFITALIDEDAFKNLPFIDAIAEVVLAVFGD